MTPLVIRVENLATGVAVQAAFLKSPVRIGRSEINDLPLAEPFVSTWHAVVRFDEQEIAYVDLGSTNGSIHDGARLERNTPAALQPGSEVVIGGLRLTFTRRTTEDHTVPPHRATVFAMRAAELGPSFEAAGEPSSLVAAISAAAAAAASAEAGAPAAPAPVLPAGEDPAAAAAATQALEAAELDIDLLYASFQGTFQHLKARVEEAVGGLDAPAQAIARARLGARFPELAEERPASGSAGPAAEAPPVAAAPVAAGRSPSAGQAATQLLGAFAESYLPASITVQSRQEVERFLGKLAEVLEAYSRSYVELRKGFDEFGKQMGVRTVHGDGPLQRARDARQVMAYLLDPVQQGRAAELQGAFADLMVHEVALLNGITEGAKAMLANLSPDAIAEENPGGIWPMRAQALWKAYQVRFHEAFDEESAISEALFGKEFARAYATIVGRGEPEGGSGQRQRQR